MKRILHLLEDMLWPRQLKCLCCDALSEGDFLCPSCRKGLQVMRLSPGASANGSISSAYQYDGVAKQLVLLLKMSCVEDAAHALAEGMAEEVRLMKLPSETILTWVTMPEIRKRERGIDHGRLLCEALALKTGMPVEQLLVRSGRIHTQRGLNYEERMQNLSGSISCPDRIVTPVLLVDDVLTTGATASTCAQVLMQSGAPQVYVLTATRVSLKKVDE